MQRAWRNEERMTHLCFQKGRSVIRSLGEDARVVLVERRRSKYVSTANGRLPRGKRTVAHNIAGTASLLAVMVRRRPFFQEDPLIMFLTSGLSVMPPNKVEVEPYFVVAALIGRAQLQDLLRNGESNMKPYFPVPIGYRKLKEPTNFSPIAWNGSRSPRWCGARRHRQGAVGKRFYESADIVVPVVASPRSTVEDTGNQVHTFVKHHCAKCMDELLSFLAWALLMCNDRTVNVFWPLRGCRRKEARDSTPCETFLESLPVIFTGNSRLVWWKQMDLTSTPVVNTLNRLLQSNDVPFSCN